MADADHVVPPPAPVSVAVAGTDRRFPVRRIYCVGRNYADHIREMGGDERDPPFFFQKPPDAIVPGGAVVAYPSITGDFQHEVELVLAIGVGGSDIATASAGAHVFGAAVGIDLTRRDVQVKARKTGRPWEIGKSFDCSAPIGTIAALDGRALPVTGTISLLVNGKMRQCADLDDMIWKADEIVCELSRQYRLEPGDLIYTGTPAGVAALVPGDRIDAQIDGLPTLSITIDGTVPAG